METHSAPSQPPALLLVDDDAAFLRTLGRSFGRLGYMVWPALTVDEARQAIDSTAPDFAVVDLHLAGENGLDVLEYLAMVSPRTTSVLLSGYATPASAVKATKLGAADCLPKPASIDEIEHAFQGRRGGAGEAPATVMSPCQARLQHILAHWEKNDRNTMKAAKALGMHRRTLQRILSRAGMGRTTDMRLETPSRFAKRRRLLRVWRLGSGEFTG